MPVYTVDLRSDTITQPTAEMRRAIFEATVGDDVYGEDPTVVALEKQTAAMFGKEAGLFVPSGTMGNLLAFMVHCNRRGTEAIVGDMSHTILYEQGNGAQIAGVQLATIKNLSDGTFCLNELQRKIRHDDIHEPITALVVVENTHNICGGRVVPLAWLDSLAQICKNATAPTKRIALHMDGARVFNAAEALKVPVARIAKDFDSVSCCLSKGLSAPVGSVLVGSRVFIAEARRMRKALGGGMRQVGIVAAAGLVALDTMVSRLVVDHKRAQQIAQAIHNLNSPHFAVALSNIETNIFMVYINHAGVKARDLAARLVSIGPEELRDGLTGEDGRKEGITVKVGARDWNFIRIVLHNGINDVDVQMAIKKIEYVIREYDKILNETQTK